MAHLAAMMVNTRAFRDLISVPIVIAGWRDRTYMGGGHAHNKPFLPRIGNRALLPFEIFIRKKKY